MSGRRLRVLAVAYACSPSTGSEAGVGWGWVRMIAERHDLTVLTAAYNRADLAGREPAGTEFVYVPHRPWHYAPTPAWRAVEASPAKPLMNLAYRTWLAEATRAARRLHAERPFDLVHLITYVGFRFPGGFWRLPCPLVWGPLGGLEDVPWRLLPHLGLRGAVTFAGRNVLNLADKALLPGPRRAVRRAGPGLIAATSGIRDELRRWYGADSTVICEVGPPPVDGRCVRARQSGEPLRIVWSGNHEPAKALPFLLRTLARLGGELDWTLDVLGHGPCTRRWRRIAARLGLDGRCRWHGRLSRDQALDVTAAGHLLAITSVKDLTSTVLLEALSLGLPVVCPDGCGFADVVDESCGVRYPAGSASAIVEGLAAALRRMGDEDQRRRLADGAHARAMGFDWDAKAEAVEAVYRAALVDAAAGDAR